jgi:hypothetical protein
MKKDTPTFPLGNGAIIACLILFPIGIPILFIATLIYLARWTCYNLSMPNVFCYILALLFTPIFFPLLLLSFIFKAVTGQKEYIIPVEKDEGYERRSSPRRSSPRRSSPRKSSPRRS